MSNVIRLEDESIGPAPSWDEQAATASKVIATMKEQRMRPRLMSRADLVPPSVRTTYDRRWQDEAKADAIVPSSPPKQPNLWRRIVRFVMGDR